jgi:hypothetical protein
VTARTPDDLIGMLRQFRQRLERLESRRHAPTACWSRIDVAGNGAVTVTFPEGLFSDPPTVLVTIESTEPAARAQLSAVTEATCTITVSGATRPGVVHWHALAS